MFNDVSFNPTIETMRAQDAVEAQWFTMRTVLEYYDAFEALVIRDSSFGGTGGDLILNADLVLRTEMFRTNTLPTNFNWR